MIVVRSVMLAEASGESNSERGMVSFHGLLWVTYLPFSTVAAKDRSSCCLRSMYYPSRSRSQDLKSGRHATFNRHENRLFIERY